MNLDVAKKDISSQDLPECIYLNDNLSCSILRTPRCEGSLCSFCRTYLQSKSSNENAVKMLNDLSLEEQKKIASAYYGGKMPWKSNSKSKR